MEREIWYRGMKLTSMEWQGMPEVDTANAGKAVRHAFKNFPEPMPPQPRLLWIARILSAYVRRPLVDELAAKAGQRAPFDPIAFTRDQKLEEAIVAEALRHYGVARLDKWFREEKMRLGAAAATAKLREMEKQKAEEQKAEEQKP